MTTPAELDDKLIERVMNLYDRFRVLVDEREPGIRIGKLGNDDIAATLTLAACYRLPAGESVAFQRGYEQAVDAVPSVDRELADAGMVRPPATPIDPEKFFCYRCQSLVDRADVEMHGIATTCEPIPTT